MARTARIKSKTGIYHIVLRGNNKQQIFLEEEDYKRLLDIVSDYSKSCDYSILAYCLMGNHIHLLIQEDKKIRASGYFGEFAYSCLTPEVSHLM